MQQFVMRLLLGIFTHKLCRRKWGRGRNKEEKEEKWRMKRVKRKAMGREGNEGRRRMGQQHTDVSLHQGSKHNRTTPTQTSPIHICASQHKASISHSFSGWGEGEDIHTSIQRYATKNYAVNVKHKQN